MEEPGSQPAADQAAEAETSHRAVEDEEEEEARRLEELRLEEEAARRRREEVEESLRRKREAREAEEKRREEERKRKSEEEAASAKAEAKFDELERRLEEEERGGAKRNGDAHPKTGDSTAAQVFSEGEIAELQIYISKWVPCRILGVGSKPDTWSVHILPTTLFDNAAGRSDKDVPDVPVAHLRKAVAEPAAAKAPQPTEVAVAADSTPAPAPIAPEEGTASPRQAAEGGSAVAVAAEAAPESALAASSGGGGDEGAAAQSGKDGEEGGTSAAAPTDSQASPELDAPPPEPAEQVYEVGGRVVITGLDDKPQLNGNTGTLIEKKWKGNWVVDLDDEAGKKKRLRRRWLINEINFEASEKAEIKKYSADLGRPKQQYFIVGSWNDYVPRRMTWDHERLCWTFEVKVGTNGCECFQIWLERDKRKSVHPDTGNAGTYVPWELRGPDADGENKNWSFGNEKNEGTRFEVRLFLWEDESPQSVEWSDLEAAKKKAAEANGSTGEQANTAKCLKGHDLKVFKPPVDGYSCSKCKKAYPKGTTFLSCRPCDYDICNSCASGSKAAPDSSATAKAKADPGIQQDAKKFLESCDKDGAEGGGGSSSPAAAPPSAKTEALGVGDKVVIKSSGPFKGRTGTVMRVDEDGDPAVRLETGEAKLFYRSDVDKVASASDPAAPATATATATASANGSGRGYPGRGMMGKGSVPFTSLGGKGSSPLAKGFGPGVLGFR